MSKKPQANEENALSEEERAQQEEARHLEKAKKYAALFENEILPHKDALYSFALFHTRDSTNADDLVQETFLKAYRFIESFEQGSNAKAWLFTILKNEFINEYRKRGKRPTTSVEELTPGMIKDEEDSDFSTYVDLRAEIFDQMMGDEVITAIESLTPEFRDVIILCDIEDFKYEEIANIIGIKIGTVRSRLHRARNALKKKLADYAREKGYIDE